MNADAPLVISLFTNPSGEIIFRVSGWLDKRFTTQQLDEATRICRVIQPYLDILI